MRWWRAPRCRPARSDGRRGRAAAATLAAVLASAGGVLAAPARAGSGAVALLGEWSPDEREAVDRVVARLPAAVTAGRPRLVARDAAACGGDGFPDDDRLVDGGGGIHLCAARAGAGAGDIAWQVAAALSFAFDRTAGWSEDPAWRHLNGWRASIPGGLRARPANTEARGFAAPRGRRSPRWDLATFLVALSIESTGEDGGVGCRLLSQAAFVRARLGAPPGSGRCGAFVEWADLDHLAGIEVVLAAPSTVMAASLFGHVLLRLVYRDEDGETPPHLSRAVAFLADNDVPFDQDPAYAWKGIVGLYDATLHERAFLDAYREYVVNEGRDLRRWRLDLGAAERRAVMERLWTVAHGARYPYYFFRRNCATLMVDLLDEALPPERAVAIPGLVAAPPASALEAWADARGADGAPLLQFVPEPIVSFEHEARTRTQHRSALEPRIAGALGPGASAAATAAFRDAHAPTPEARARAYDRLADLLAGAEAGAPADVAAWLRDSAAVESHLSTLANLEAEARAERERRRRVRAAADDLAARLRLDARLAGAVEASSAADPSARLAGYRALLAVARDPGTAPDIAARVRLYALLRSEARYDVARMKAAPGLRDALLFPDAERPIDEQPYLGGHAELMRLPTTTRISAPLRSLQRARQRLTAARALGERAPRAEDEAQQVAAEARREYDAARPHSGLDQMAVAGAAMLGGNTVAAGLALGGALYDERLGDHRRFGFPSDTALVVARSDALLIPSAGVPGLAAYDTRAFGYRSLRAALPESGARRWPHGWELYADVAGSRTRALAAEAKLGWGLLVPILDRGELTDHLIAGIALAYDGAFPAAGAMRGGHPQALAVPLTLEARAGLGAAPRYRSFVAARVWAQPLAVLAGAPARLGVEAGAAADLHLALGERSVRAARDPAFLLAARVLRTPLAFTGGAAAVEALVSVGVELR